MAPCLGIRDAEELSGAAVGEIQAAIDAESELSNDLRACLYLVFRRRLLSPLKRLLAVLGQQCGRHQKWQSQQR